MKFGFRNPSLSKRNAVRTSLKRAVRHNLGVKAPKGFGWLKDPKKAAYNKVYKNESRFFGSGNIHCRYGYDLYIFLVSICPCSFCYCSQTIILMSVMISEMSWCF